MFVLLLMQTSDPNIIITRLNSSIKGLNFQPKPASRGLFFIPKLSPADFWGLIKLNYRLHHPAVHHQLKKVHDWSLESLIHETCCTISWPHLTWLCQLARHAAVVGAEDWGCCHKTFLESAATGPKQPPGWVQVSWHHMDRSSLLVWSERGFWY